MNVFMPNILKLDAAGQPMDWINYEKAAYYYCSNKVAWDMGNPATLHGGINAVSMTRSTIEAKPIISVMGEIRGEHRIPPITNKTLYARDLHTCGYCGQRYASRLLTKDHIHPQSRGGEDSWMNLITACYPCNNYKGHRDIDDIWNMKLKFVPYVPDYAEHLILANKGILAEQKDYLMPFIKNELSRIIH